jgi:hypothetical protein
MKRIIYLIVAIIAFLTAFNLDWFFEGQSAIQATQQVKRGYDYQSGKLALNFWENLKMVPVFMGPLFLFLFLKTFFKPKEAK